MFVLLCYCEWKQFWEFHMLFIFSFFILFYKSAHTNRNEHINGLGYLSTFACEITLYLYITGSNHYSSIILPLHSLHWIHSSFSVWIVYLTHSSNYIPAGSLSLTSGSVDTGGCLYMLPECTHCSNHIPKRYKWREMSRSRSGFHELGRLGTSLSQGSASLVGWSSGWEGHPPTQSISWVKLVTWLAGPFMSSDILLSLLGTFIATQFCASQWGGNLTSQVSPLSVLLWHMKSAFDAFLWASIVSRIFSNSTT